MKKVFLVMMLAVMALSPVFADGDYRDPNIPKAPGGMWLWDGSKWYPATRNASGALVVEAEVSIGSLSVSVPPSFLDSSDVATSAVLTSTGKVPVDLGTAEVTMSPLKATLFTKYTVQLGTGTPTSLYNEVSPGVGDLVLIQCRAGNCYIGGTTDTAASLQASGHKLEAGESFPIFRHSGQEACDINMVGDSTSVATISIFLISEQ